VTAPPLTDRVTVRVLGPVEAVVDGRPLDIGPRQRRAVLAALAVDAGTPVPIDALADRVWGGMAPDAPRSALYAHVARLRRVLGPGEAGSPVSLSRHSEGYVLDIDRDAVDVHRFRNLVEAARTVTGPERLAILREALDLWRGRPLSTLSSDWAAQVRAGVESQFVGAAAAWATEELGRANPEPVAERLAGLMGDYPLAEPLVDRLMRALCAVGRTAEALQIYADTRERLADQLGAEPGAELRDLHLAILRGGADGFRPVVAPAPRTPVDRAPRQLPADLSRFTGRVRELAGIEESLAWTRSDGAAAVAAIHGGAGVGKSALAVRVAHRLSQRYPDGQLYVDLRGAGPTPPLSTAEALARLLRTVGFARSDIPTNVDEAAALFRSFLAARRILLVLDNAVDAEQVRPLLPGGPGCATVVSSRRMLVGLGDVEQVCLEPLTREEATRLLGRWTGTARVAAEPVAAQAIVRACEGLPLALCLVGARLAARPGWPLARLADRLADRHRLLDTLEFQGFGVRASLAASHRQLAGSPDPADRAAAGVFAVLGAAGRVELDSAAVADLLGRPPAEVERALERLVDLRLLDTPSPYRYRMSRLVGLYAAELAGPPRSRQGRGKGLEPGAG
jgi:DNA-binding SARP family transcriptional activator